MNALSDRILYSWGISELFQKSALDSRRGGCGLMYMTHFRVKQFAKAHTPLGRVLTSSRPWAQPPHAGEAPVGPIAAESAVGESAAAPVSSCRGDRRHD